MAKQTITRTSTKERQKKRPDNTVQCNMCKGKGYMPKGYNKKKAQ